MKQDTHSLYIDFDPIADYNGQADGALSDELVINKTISVFNDLFSLNDTCILKLTQDCSSKRRRKFKPTLLGKPSRSRIHKNNPYFKCIKDLQVSDIKYNKRIEKFIIVNNLYVVTYRDALILTTVAKIDIKKLFHLLLINKDWNAIISKGDKAFSFQLSIDQYGFRLIEVKSMNDEFIKLLTKKYKSWNIENESKVEKDKLTCAMPGESLVDLLDFLKDAAGIELKSSTYSRSLCFAKT